jgi:drug/metabolite transporter (DMT)-like permease
VKSAYVELTISTLFYGVSYPLTALALRQMGPLSLGMARSFWAFLFFIGYFSIHRQNLKKFNLWLLLAIALTGLVFPLLLLNFGMLYTTASLAGIIQATTPIMVLIFAYFFLKEKILGQKVVGILLGLTGTALVVFEGHAGNSASLGNVLILGSAVSLAALAILEKISLSKYAYEPIEILGMSSILGFFPLLFVSIPIEGVISLSAPILFYSIILSFVCTLIPYFLWLDGLKSVEISKAILFTYAIPVFGIAFSFLILGQGISILAAVGMIIIFLSIWIAQK